MDTLKVADVHHISLALYNLVDYARPLAVFYWKDVARWTIPGARVLKRYLSYGWGFVLLLMRRLENRRT